MIDLPVLDSLNETASNTVLVEVESIRLIHFEAIPLNAGHFPIRLELDWSLYFRNKLLISRRRPREVNVNTIIAVDDPTEVL